MTAPKTRPVQLSVNEYMDIRHALLGRAVQASEAGNERYAKKLHALYDTIKDRFIEAQPTAEREAETSPMLENLSEAEIKGTK